MSLEQPGPKPPQREDMLDANSQQSRAALSSDMRPADLRSRYARHVVTRPRQDITWSPFSLARAPLLGPIDEDGAEYVPTGAALALQPATFRALHLYHSGRAPPLAPVTLPDEILRSVFDALVPVATWRPVKEKEPGNKWWLDHKLLTKVIQSCWIEMFAW